jgi:exodeoxyribonuclease VII small subunit
MGKWSVLLNQNKNPMSESISYTDAFAELQEIVADIEGGEISVDQLSEKVKRAAFLIKVCKTKLTTTEEDVNKILKELDGSGEVGQ